jgi:(p)ppGpp synthase/HD superfamily hydrolase
VHLFPQHDARVPIWAGRTGRPGRLHTKWLSVDPEPGPPDQKFAWASSYAGEGDTAATMTAEPAATPLTPRFDAALVFASDLHRMQFRKTTKTPYVSHLLGVAAIVLENGGSEDEAIAALLHDAVEDQGGAATRAEILNRFGSCVAEIVDGCTEDRTNPALTRQQRKQVHLESIRKASPSVALVYAADKLHNARTVLAGHRALGETVWQRFGAGREGTIWYYSSAVDSLRGRVPPPLFDELEEVIQKLRELNRQR